jgi:hypothetical protein
MNKFFSKDHKIHKIKDQFHNFQNGITKFRIIDI